MGDLGLAVVVLGVVVVLVLVLVVVLVLVIVLVIVVVLIGVVLAGLVVVLIVDLDVVRVAVPVAVLLVVLERPPLEVADQGGELAGQGVDLVAPQRRPGGELRLGVVEDAVEAEDERVVALPLIARLEQPTVHLGDRGVERGAPDRALGERDRWVLAFMQ